MSGDRAVPFPERGRGTRRAASAGRGLGARRRRVRSRRRVLGGFELGDGFALDLDRVPRRAGTVFGEDRELAGAQHDLVACARASGSTTPSRARRSNTESTPASAGATRASSSVTSSTVAKSKSAPSRSASSTAMRQSSIAVPSGATLRPTRCTRPSRFVTLPVFSPQSVQGNATSARLEVPVRNAPTAIIFFAPAMPRRARSASGKSATGSEPKIMSTSILPAAAASRMPCASSPFARGTRSPHADSNHSRPASSETRPGRKPGTRPESIAPCTLPRRSAERKRTSGTSRSAPRGAHRDGRRFRERARGRARRRPGRGDRRARAR